MPEKRVGRQIPHHIICDVLERWRLISGALLFALMVYAVFAVITIFRQIGTQNDVRDNLANTTPETIGTVIAEVRELESDRSGVKQELLLYYLLLQESWYFPERSADNLHEMVELGPVLYLNNPAAKEHLGPEVAFAYYLAGLPSMVTDWNKQVLIEAPHVRPRLKFIEVAAWLYLDREDQARQLIEDELEATGNSRRTKLFAFLAYMVLEDLDRAEEIGVDPVMVSQMDFNQRLAWASYLLYYKKFEKAYEQFKTLNIRAEEFPDRAYDQALARAAFKGIDDLEVQVLLEQSAKSPRNPRSVAGQKALICSTLFEIKQDQEWVEQLAALYHSNPDDFWTATALFEAVMVYQRDGLEFEGDNHTLLSEVTTVSARRCLALAETEYQRQWANLLLARALAYVALNPVQPLRDALDEDDSEPQEISDLPVEYGKTPEQLLEQSALYLRQATGDISSPEPVISQRLPDYDFFLVDPSVKKARAAYPQFDTDVHNAVVEFLERRAAEYESIVGQIDIRAWTDYTGPETITTDPAD